jgi:hypothetical protein
MENHAAKKKNNDTTEKSILTPMPLPPKLERSSSLDAKPKTLFEDELRLARVRFFFDQFVLLITYIFFQFFYPILLKLFLG